MKTVNIDLNDPEPNINKLGHTKLKSNRQNSLISYPQSQVNEPHNGDTGDVRISMISAKTHGEKPTQKQTNGSKINCQSTSNVKSFQSKTFGLKGKSIGMIEQN